MGKRSRVKARQDAAPDTSADGQVGPRQPCPCGSGRRYKNCHGSKSGAPAPFVRRPFEGMAAECDLVALREFVPAATAPLTLRDGVHTGDRTVLLASLLPGAAPAIVRADGTILLGMQVQHGYGDAARDLGAVLERALEAEPGSVVGLVEDPGEGPRLPDLVVDEPLDITVHEGFDYWVEGGDDDGTVAAALEQANAAASPTVRLADRPAYWTSVGDHEFLRWAMPEDEDQLLDALARLHHAGKDRLVEDARLIGMFRAQGILVPVWEVPVGTGAEVLAEPIAAFADELAATLEAGAPLSSEERATRAGLTSRQLTLR